MGRSAQTPATKSKPLVWLVAITAIIRVLVSLQSMMHTAPFLAIGMVLLLVLASLLIWVLRKGPAGPDGQRQLRPSKFKWLVLLLTALVAGGLAAVVSLLAYVQISTERDEVSWVKTDAIIQTYDTRPSPVATKWSPFWTYTYKVAGHDYSAKSNALPTASEIRWYSTEAKAREFAMTRAPGQRVDVWYNPQDPQEAVLDRHLAGDTDTPVEAFAGGFVIAFVVLIVLLLRTRKALWQKNTPLLA